VHRHAAADIAFMIDDSVGQLLDYFACNAFVVWQALKEGTDPLRAVVTGEALDVPAEVTVLVNAVIFDIADHIAQLYSIGFAFRFVEAFEIPTNSIAPTVDTETGSDT